jgi:hypothetical protein
MENAIITNNLKKFKILHKKGYALDEEVFQFACTNGDINLWEYLFEMNCPWDSTITVEVVKCGNLDCLQFLHAKKYEFHEWTCDFAAYTGQLECLKFLHTHNYYWSEITCIEAAKRNHLDCLQYLYENECPWNEKVCETAAECGHLHILEYLHERGCPWDESAINAAINEEDFDCLKYLLDNGCPITNESFQTCCELFKMETWFQLYMYKEKNIIDQYTLHIHHKILRIQKAWQKYVQNPKTKFGFTLMMKSINDMTNDVNMI